MLNCYSSLSSKHSGARVLVVGHSLGGAMANFMVIDLYQRFGKKTDYFYTMGAPRVGNTAFANYVDSIGINAWRLVHARDMVPHLPTENMGFTHNGVEVWYEKGMRSW